MDRLNLQDKEKEIDLNLQMWQAKLKITLTLIFASKLPNSARYFVGPWEERKRPNIINTLRVLFTTQAPKLRPLEKCF